MEDQQFQRTLAELKVACALFPGPCLNYRAFRQSGPRRLRSVADAEFRTAIKELSDEGLGTLHTIRVARAQNSATIFCKKNPSDPTLDPWPSNICRKEQYVEKFNKTCHKAITSAMRNFLVARGVLN